MKILKFGGKSLSFPENIQNVLSIVENDLDQKAIVVSAIGNSTDDLLSLLDAALNRTDYQSLLNQFIKQKQHDVLVLKEEFDTLTNILEGVKLLGDYSPKIKDQTIALGEIISAKVLTQLLVNKGIKAQFVDSRQLFVTDSNFGNARPNDEVSRKNTKRYFDNLDQSILPIVTGFIAADENKNTTTLGRNGSNYSAALLANYLDAKEMQNFTHVDGIYTANPDWVTDAQQIKQLHFNEANELANFGANILHSKTIHPLIEKNIPLRVLNTTNPSNKGTLISGEPTAKGIKSLTVQSEVALIYLEGRGLLGKTGIDARIFNTLATADISVGLISQGTSERGIGFIIPKENAKVALTLLQKEFEKEFISQDVQAIQIKDEIAVISIIGQDLNSFDKAFNALIKNKITPILFNNTITGNTISIVVPLVSAKKAINVIHGQIFGISKRINLAIFGHGTVGGALIDQILANAESIEEKKNIKLNIIAIGNSKQILLEKNGIGKNWRNEIQSALKTNSVSALFEYADANHLENLIAIDNTASGEFIHNYIPFIENGFDLISSNKVANTVSFDFYKNLREKLKLNQKEYLYETNVGAGLPLIDTIQLLHLSGENITKIRGVFSGTLSYLFNTFSNENTPFNEVLQKAIDKGFTEPDPREDLSGNDVARKLLILARELDLENEFEEIEIENLIPEEYTSWPLTDFLAQLDLLNPLYTKIKNEQKEGNVLRYIGELSGNLQQNKGVLETKLVSVPKQSALGQLSGSDSIFEIYTESYGENPIVIQGAGAGAQVTARGVFGDILRLANKK